MIPVLFGPNHIKFVEASELIKLKLAKEISTFNEFKDAVNSFIPNYKKDTAINHFKNQDSAVSIIMKLIYKN